MKQCTRCRAILPPAMFYPDPRTRDALRPDCKGCVSERMSDYYFREPQLDNSFVARHEAKRQREQEIAERLRDAQIDEEPDKAIPFFQICARVVMGSGPAKFRSAWRCV